MLESTHVPHFADRTCASVRVCRFVILYAVILAIFIGGMTAIGLSQCGENAAEDDNGCFIGMFIFGFFGGSLTLFFPMMYWVLTAASVRNRRMEAAYKLVEAGPAAVGGGPSGLIVVNGRSSSSSARPLVQVGIPPPGGAHAAMSARAAQKAAEIENAPFSPATAPVAPSAPDADDDDDDRGDEIDRLEGTLCVVCCDAPRTSVLTPCGHVASCKKCSALLLKTGKTRGCPICRRPIEAVVELHIA